MNPVNVTFPFHFLFFHASVFSPQDWQKKLSLLLPEQQRLTEKLRNINLNKISCGSQMTARATRTHNTRR